MVVDAESHDLLNSSIDSDIQSPFTGDGDYEIVRRNYWRKRFFDPVDAVLADLR